MSQSANINELAKALAAAQASIGAAKKDGHNPHFGSAYSTLQSVWEAAKEVLSSNGLSVTQTFESSDGRTMNITTTLLHNSGQWIAGTLSMCPQQATPQGIGSAITYGRRYSLAAILGIVADEDDDGNAASHGEAPPKPVKAVSRPVPHPAPPPPAPATPRPATGSGWRSVVVPPFIKKYAGQTLGDMEDKDLLWWAANYTPKPFKGEVHQKDIDFKDALTAAQDDLQGRDSEPTDHLPGDPY